MPVKVGINGFGRIGRNIFRAALGDPAIEIVAVNDITDSKTLAHLLKYDSILGNLPNKVTHTDDTISVDGKSFKVFEKRIPRRSTGPSVGASIVVESTGLVHHGRGRAQAHSRAGEESNHLRAGHRSRPHDRARRERQDLRSGEAPRDLERVVHHELPRAGRESYAGHLRNHGRHDDHDSLLHERPEAARFAAQGSAPRPCRRTFDDSDFHRRSEGAATS